MARVSSAGIPLGAGVASSVPAMPATTAASRHSALVRVTHWITTLCFVALLVSGVEILISHPRFYWGETGNVLTTPLFKIPIPSSRALVPTGYGYVLPDQNGWSRYLHFQAAWVAVLHRATCMESTDSLQGISGKICCRPRPIVRGGRSSPQSRITRDSRGPESRTPGRIT